MRSKVSHLVSVACILFTSTVARADFDESSTKGASPESFTEISCPSGIASELALGRVFNSTNCTWECPSGTLNSPNCNAVLCQPACPRPQVRTGCDCTCPESSQPLLPGQIQDPLSCKAVCPPGSASGPINGIPDPTNVCRSICPSQTYLYPVDNTCYPRNVLCTRVQAQIIDVGVTSYHPNTTPSITSDFAFYDMNNNAAPFGSVSDLNMHSSCMAWAVNQCNAIFPNPISIGGIKAVWGNGDVDACIRQVFHFWGLPALTNQGLLPGGAFGSPSVVYSNGMVTLMRNQSGGCGAPPQWLKNLRADLNCPVSLYHFHELTSPVSLLWNDTVEIDQIRSYTTFPLAPKNKGEIFLWRASGITPLVVFDPKHSGEIKEASQLFGNHSFNKSWKDGYQALASLDKDKNYLLQKEELKDLALWFDFNQNGVSEKDEVKTLDSVGVTAIGVKSSRQDPKTKSIFADKGYVRLVDGKEVVGKSVDWFGGVVPEDLSKTSSREYGSELSSDNSTSNGMSKSFSKSQIDITKSINGIWKWQVSDDNRLLPEQRPGGTLAITHRGDKIWGSSISGRTFQKNMYKIDEELKLTTLFGEVSNEASKVKIEFKVKETESDIADSRAELSDDGLKMFGVTSQVLVINGKPERFVYHWSALRVGAD